MTLPMSARVVRDELVVSVDAIGAEDRFLNGLESSVTIEGPNEAEGERMQQTLQLVQSAPGRYEAHVRLERYGSFALHAVHARDGRVVAHSQAQASHPYPPEYAARPPDRALLEGVSALTSGSPLAAAAHIFDRGSEAILARGEFWPATRVAGARGVPGRPAAAACSRASAHRPRVARSQVAGHVFMCIQL